MKEKLKATDGWISVEDRLPELDDKKTFVGQYVIARIANASDAIPKYEIGNVHRDGNYIVCENEHVLLSPVTHWMQIPELSKK